MIRSTTNPDMMATPVVNPDGSDINSTVTVTSAEADGSSNTVTRTRATVLLKGYNGSTWDRIRAGVNGVVSSITGYMNTINVGRYNASGVSLTDGQYVNHQMDANGNLRTNPGAISRSIDSIDTQWRSGVTHIAVNATTASAEALAAGTRKLLIIQNASDTTINLNMAGITATTTSGLQLIANANLILDQAIPTTSITAIHGASGNKSLLFTVMY